MRKVALFLVILSLGIFLRVINDTNHKLYPDYYQNTLVAQNIASDRAVTGFLGEGGVFFPKVVGWARPVYPLFILLANWFTQDLDLSAQIVSVFFSITTLPLFYLVLNKIYRKEEVAFTGLFLLAVSFNHSVWGGFRLTEPVGVFFICLYLLALINNSEKHSVLGQNSDLVLGALLGILTFIRFEYAILLIPTLYLFKLKNVLSKYKIINFLFGYTATVLCFLFLLFPFKQMLPALIMQNLDIAVSVVVIGSAFLFLTIKKPSVIDTISNSSLKYMHLFALSIPLVIIFYYAFPSSDLSRYVSGISRFFVFDFLVGFSFLLGLKSKNMDRGMALLCYSSLFVLGSSYLLLNPTVLRYSTHLLPFILIPASYGAWEIISRSVTKNKWHALLIGAFALVQIYISYLGTSIWVGDQLKITGYKEEVAVKLMEHADLEDKLLLVSTPESFYYHTKATVQSVSNTSPYIFLNTTPANTNLVLVEDAGMRVYFPAFVSALKAADITNYLSAQYVVPSVYYVGSAIISDNYPVYVYNLSLGELSSILQQSYKD